MKKWTREKILKELMAVLRRGNTTISMHPLNGKREVANSHWESNGSLDITIDPFQCAIFGGVIHELLHFVLRSTHSKNMDYWVEEPQIQALEDKLVYHITQNSRLLNKWRKLINNKLGRNE